ncbi:hypothetical protein [Amycolatopsis rifamycinica]|uniref:Uncharacterized protein n=1 Tax=Amycolatopsis rifamycinica TaxID=287986 RepID=A0A066TWH4_9PSEU|nr:hypothetical protein [Amycolatopsis rifamycinica]KDN19165.1 hypothetical protein DV20_26270 [Amycolatopsis rifamycinica]
MAHAGEFRPEGRVRDVASGHEATMTARPRADERRAEGPEPGAVRVASVDAFARHEQLAGHSDRESRRLWPPALERAGPRPEGTITLDAAGPDFAERRGLGALAGSAERHATTLKPTTPARLVALPDLPGVRVERAA